MSKDPVTCVLPYRFGDICIALPIVKNLFDSGNAVNFVTHESFIDLLDGVSYVHPIPWTGAMGDIKGALQVAQQGGGRILCLKSSANPFPLSRNTQHFSAEIWERAGMLANYHDWPLVFDRRNREREAKLIEKFVPPDDGRPLVSYNFKCYSMRFNGANAAEEWLLAENEKRGNPVRLINLGAVGAYRLYDMLGILELCRAQFSVDTSLVHLAKATQTPTAVIVQDRDYDSPEPERHWIDRYTSRAITMDAGKERLADQLFNGNFELGRLVRHPDRMYAKMIAFVSVASEDTDPTDLQAASSSRLTAQRRDKYFGEIDINVPCRHLGSKKCIDTIIQMLPADYIAMARPDTCITGDAAKHIRIGLSRSGCVYSPMVYADTTHPKESIDLPNDEPDLTDGFVAFSVQWISRHIAEIPQNATWADVWRFVRRRAIPTDVPCAYKQPKQLQEINSWPTDTNSLTAPIALHGMEQL